MGSKCAPKNSVTSVCSVREKTPQRISNVLSHMEGAFFFSQIYTEEQNTQHSTETLSQPISQNLTATEASPPCLTPFNNMSFPIQEHALLHSRTCPSTSKNTPFLMLDKALLQRNLQPSDFMQVTETDEAYILNGNIMLVGIMTQKYIMTERTCFVVFFMFIDRMTERHR